MYLCICNSITDKDIIENPELKKLIGTICGKCISDGGETGFDGVEENLKDNSSDDVIVKQC